MGSRELRMVFECGRGVGGMRHCDICRREKALYEVAEHYSILLWE